MLPHVKCTSPARINISHQIYMRCVCIYDRTHAENEERGRGEARGHWERMKGATSDSKRDP